MTVKGFFRLAVVLVVFALAVAGCGSSSGSSSAGGAGASPATAPTQTVHFAKTKFVLHVGLAFGAFHRYIYKPLRAGVFAKPLSHKAALVKAALASAFIIHELKIAYTDAQSSPTLRKLLSPLTDLKAKATAMVAGLKAGHYDPTQVSAAQGDVASIASQAAGAGAQVRDLPVPAF
ncbi:MAG: hypothetical protein ACR2L9_10955 [Solirubrobacteraceae bacterium]